MGKAFRERLTMLKNNQIGPKDAEEWLKCMGYPQDQVEKSIKACGKDCSLFLLVDFIQAHFGSPEIQKDHSDKERLTVLKNNQIGPKDAQEWLKCMGYPQDQVEKAIKACGKDCSFFLLVDFIQAHFESSKTQKDHADKESLTMLKNNQICLKDAEEWLKFMGYPQDQVEKAIKACGKDCSLFLLVDFIQAHFGSPETQKDHAEEERLTMLRNNKIGFNDAEERLKSMGYPKDQVEKAIESCGKDCSLFLLADFVQAHFGNPETQKDHAEKENLNMLRNNKIGSKDAEECLKCMGYPQDQVEKAIKSCGKDCSLFLLADFIQAHFGSHETQNDHEDKEWIDSRDAEEWLKCMGYPQDQVDKAIKAHGKDCSLFLLADFIQAHFGSSEIQEDHADKEMPSIAGDNQMIMNDAEKYLKSMGYHQDQITTALKACGKDYSLSTLTDFILSNFGSLEAETPKDSLSFINDNQEKKSIAGDDKMSISDAEICLKSMGYHQDQVEVALKACGQYYSLSSLTDFLTSHFGSLETQKDHVPFTNNNQETIDRDALVVKICDEWKGNNYEGRSASCENNDNADQERSICVASWLEQQYDTSDVDSEELETFNYLDYGESDSSCKEKVEKPISSIKRIRISGSPSNIIQNNSTDSQTDNIEEDLDFIVDDNEKSAGAEFYCKREESKQGWSTSKNFERFGSTRNKSSNVTRVGRMIGFGVPGFPNPTKCGRLLNAFMEGPPYFYFENVASMPKNTWGEISRHFNGVEPEFVNSKYFSASKRPRGYIHNLPLEGREAILPTPAMSIQDALPYTNPFWPNWDDREKLNCITSRRASAVLCNKVKSRVAQMEGEDGIIGNATFSDAFSNHKELLKVLKVWNLVWVGPGQVAPLEAHDMELLLGFDRDHTRGSGTTLNRYHGLANSFQIHTVAYHLSSLKPLYPDGIKVLSLFSGIGGAEVALHKLGIFIKVVVVVEILETNRNVILAWWKKTEQKGEIVTKSDVRNMTTDELAELVNQVGGFDLVIGGSPCNNLSGYNRRTRFGLEGKESSVFFEFPRIYYTVKELMKAHSLPR